MGRSEHLNQDLSQCLYEIFKDEIIHAEVIKKITKKDKDNKNHQEAYKAIFDDMLHAFGEGENRETLINEMAE